ncbi:MAG: hypothetical protein ABSF69_08915 [Polyangiaceae bacterium]|jgi:hypothetical protein
MRPASMRAAAFSRWIFDQILFRLRGVTFLEPPRIVELVFLPVDPPHASAASKARA